MDTKLRKKAKNNFENEISKPMKNSVFRKSIKIFRKQRYKTCNSRTKKKLFGNRNKVSHKKHLAMEMIKKSHILMNKPVYLVLSKLELNKIKI